MLSPAALSKPNLSSTAVALRKAAAGKGITRAIILSKQLLPGATCCAHCRITTSSKSGQTFGRRVTRSWSAAAILFPATSAAPMALPFPDAPGPGSTAPHGCFVTQNSRSLRVHPGPTPRGTARFLHEISACIARENVSIVSRRSPAAVKC